MFHHQRRRLFFLQTSQRVGTSLLMHLQSVLVLTRATESQLWSLDALRYKRTHGILLDRFVRRKKCGFHSYRRNYSRYIAVWLAVVIFLLLLFVIGQHKM